MKYGLLRTSCASPLVTVADCKSNANEIIKFIKLACEKEVSLAVFPELSITGYTCGDLFLQQTLIEESLHQLERIVEETKSCPIIFIVGLPISCGNSLFNCGAVCFSGEILAIIPKTHIPEYAEFYERRHFSSGSVCKEPSAIFISKKHHAVPFGTNILICDKTHSELSLAVEICEDLWVSQPPSGQHALSGATVIANLSASNETVGKDSYRKMLVQSQSARLLCAYLYADAGNGESTTDMVFASHNIISENGIILAESQKYTENLTIADIDIQSLSHERRRTTTFGFNNDSSYVHILIDFPLFENDIQPTNLFRHIEKHPFVPEIQTSIDNRCQEVIAIQTAGLVKRLKHTNSKGAVIGLSGGLDSTLALLITIQAFKNCSLDLKGITAITMPCFGTTDRTYNNAIKLAQTTGVTLKEIKISKAVLQHFEDIGHDKNIHDTTYENSQARERTQILMDIANETNSLVIGTGDLSELALGWATYNGDHMSMYAVNASIPKTLVRHLVTYFAKDDLHDILVDILETPVSPELLPPENGKISQKTEDLVGPYELHDFYLYNMIRRGFSPEKIFFLARNAFSQSEFSSDTILKWLKTFYKRFFSQQFKRSCMPDGPKTGSVSLSPRSDWRMPSDASCAAWICSLEKIKI